MFTEDLFRHVLITPATEKGVDRLQIVSGFATASMADRHMEQLQKLEKSIKIELIVGMTRLSGIEKAQHFALQKLVSTTQYGVDFSCRYVSNGNPVHAKTYCWFKNGQPYKAFSGSANYTLTAFGRSQIETMDKSDSQSVAYFYNQIRSKTANCIDYDIEDKVVLTETRQIADVGGEKVSLSLLIKNGETPTKSGINWGQREGRDKNQAYINIPIEIGKSGFFPDRFEQFTVLTDDGYSFVMVRAQDQGKGIHTTQNNALMGEYFRSRMGLPSGIYVTRQHLVTYGRTDVTFTKIDEETYLMDFRPNMGQEKMLKAGKIEEG